MATDYDQWLMAQVDEHFAEVCEDCEEEDCECNNLADEYAIEAYESAMEDRWNSFISDL